MQKRKNSTMEEVLLNDQKKQYASDMHTCEHILNQTMVRMFGCGRSVNAHIERKKSKCDYLLTVPPTEDQITEITSQVNKVIKQNLPVYEKLVSREEAASYVDLSKLPADASETLRLIRVGDYDTCACIGNHVENTSELGLFHIISHDFDNGRWRVRFKLILES
jgi:Ser-tRNA(Ala) deacylase AlaX